MNNKQTIDITFILQNLEYLEDKIEIKMKGIFINFNSKSFIVSVHNGYPIEKVMIDNIIYNNFIICAWCDLILIPTDDNSFAFKQFVKKQMEPEDKYYINNNDINIKLKYINNILIPIGDMICNPMIMYNCLKLDTFSDITLDIGSPIYNDKNKLVGIIGKIINNNESHYEIYNIPVNYILKAIIKIDNTKIYSLIDDLDNINKIKNYKIICNKIYCNFHKIYIPVETYVAIHGDTSIYFSIELKNGRCKRVLGFETNNNLINNKLLVDKNKIILSYGLISLLHALEEIELLEEIDKHNNESFNIKWNNYNIIINYHY
jgi:hypothetical protein